MRYFLLIPSLLFVFSCSQTILDAQNSSEQQIDQLFLDNNDLDGPGYGIGIVSEGDLVFAKGYGAADITKRRPISQYTAFNIASLSKQFTGASVQLEIQKGRIDLNDKLAEHWTNLPAFMSEISIAHLIYMTSGLPEYYTLPSPKGGWASEDGFTVDDAIMAVFKKGSLEYSPGTKWTYSNINYQLLAEMAGRLNKKSFARHLNDTIFQPLEMSNSWVDAPINVDRAEKVIAYSWNGKKHKWEIAPRQSPHYGGSGIFSSLQDLAKWDAALYRDLTFGETFTKGMLETQKFQHSKTNDGFGLVHGNYNGHKTIWYEGGDFGVSSYMVRLPDRKETYICLANFANAGCVDKTRAIINLRLEMK